MVGCFAIRTAGGATPGAVDDAAARASFACFSFASTSAFGASVMFLSPCSGFWLFVLPAACDGQFIATPPAVHPVGGEQVLGHAGQIRGRDVPSVPVARRVRP